MPRMLERMGEVREGPCLNEASLADNRSIGES